MVSVKGRFLFRFLFRFLLNGTAYIWPKLLFFLLPTEYTNNPKYQEYLGIIK